MIYLYDRAICKDLQESFNSDIGETVVKVIEPENAIAVAAQIKEDKLKFPIVVLTRTDAQVDNSLMNFTRKHVGVPAQFDTKQNNIYNEKVMPVTLSYSLHVLTTSTVDMDELIRELLFKYSDMYFLRISLPYEGERSIRFGIRIDESPIQKVSGSSDYVSTGAIYESVLSLSCEGCVLLTYTPHKLPRVVYEVEPTTD